MTQLLSQLVQEILLWWLGSVVVNLDWIPAVLMLEMGVLRGPVLVVGRLLLQLLLLLDLLVVGMVSSGQWVTSRQLPWDCSAPLRLVRLNLWLLVFGVL